jgi:hypothetical protein
MAGHVLVVEAATSGPGADPADRVVTYMNIRISYIKCESRMGETGRPTGRAPLSVKFAATVALPKLRLNGLKGEPATIRHPANHRCLTTRRFPFTPINLLKVHT